MTTFVDSKTVSGKPFNDKTYWRNQVKQLGVMDFFKVLKVGIKEEDYKIDALLFLTDEDRDAMVNPIASLELEVSERWTEYKMEMVKGEKVFILDSLGNKIKQKHYPYFSQDKISFLTRKLKLLNTPYIPFYLIVNENYTDGVVYPLAKLAKREIIKKSYNMYTEQDTRGNQEIYSDFFIREYKDYVTEGIANVETAILKHIIDLGNKLNRALYGKTIVKHKISDYLQFTKENIETVRKIAKLVNVGYSSFIYDKDYEQVRFYSDYVDRYKDMGYKEKGTTDLAFYKQLESKFRVFKVGLVEGKDNIDLELYLSEEDKIKHKDPIVSMEVDVSTSDKWVDKYPYEVVNVPNLKTLYLNHTTTPLHLLVNKDCTDSLLIPMAKIVRAKVARLRVNKKENFYRVEFIGEFTKGIDTIEESIIRYMVGVANDLHKAMVGKALVSFKIKDYVEFAIENPQVMRCVAKLVNSAHRGIYRDKNYLSITQMENQAQEDYFKYWKTETITNKTVISC